MAKVQYIQIEPEILKWARKSLNLTIDDVVNKFSKKSYQRFNLDDGLLQKIESKKEPIRFTLLKELAKFYKRPLAVFFLKQHPQEEPLPTDFRTLDPNVNKQLTPKTIMVVRKARRVQMVTNELLQTLGIEYKFGFKKYDIHNDPDKLAHVYREKLSLTLEYQKEIKDPKRLFDTLRSKLEKFGVLTIKNPFPLEDARAFSFVDKNPYIIVINNRDGEGSYSPKVFSLMHEFAHILLRKSSICNDWNDWVESSISIEKFCNQFAGSFLVPTQHFQEVSQITPSLTIEKLKDLIEKLKKVFKVSGQVLLQRALSLNMINQDSYERITKDWRDSRESISKDKKSFVPIVKPEVRAFNNYGLYFITIILQAQKADKITYDSAADYLGLRTKYLPALEHLTLKNA